MDIQSARISVRLVSAAVALAGALAAASACAKDYDVKVAIPVSTSGIDLRSTAGAQELYTRLQRGAFVACTYGDRIDLKPAYDLKECLQSALGGAVRAVNSPLLTQLYLQNHTLQQAAAHGIQAREQLAAK